MKEQGLRDRVNKVVAEFQTEPDFDAFTKARSKQFRESALEGQLDDHLGYEKHEAREKARGKSTGKKHGEMEPVTAAMARPPGAFSANRVS